MRWLNYMICTLSLSVLMAATTVSAQEDRLLFRYKGFDIHQRDLDPDLRNQLYELELQHYNQVSELLKRALIDLHIQDEAERSQQSREATAQALFPIQPPTEADLQAFYEQNKDRIRGSFAEVRDRIAQYLIDQRLQTLQDQLLTTLAADDLYQLMLPRPRPPQVEIDTAGYPSLGPAGAPVTLVEFADYQCPHCKNAIPVIKRVLARYPEQVRLVFFDMPIIQRGGISERMAAGGVCADHQGKFWAYHDRAFERQAELSLETPLELAAELGLNQSMFKTCLESPAAYEDVTESKSAGENVGVNGTPSFFVNGRQLITDDLEQGLIELIEAELREKPASSG